MKISFALPALLGLSLLGSAQTPPDPRTPNAVFVVLWQEIAQKIEKMADEMPENKYDHKPVDGVRTFADQMLHVAFWNNWVVERAAGGKPDGKPDQYPRSDYKTKADVAKVVKKSFDDVLASLKKETDASTVTKVRLWAEFLEHNGEHYGQLVQYYRTAGLVPPESRK